MRINLIPEGLRPTRPSPVPYMPLAGLAAISVIWLITQFAAASQARTKLKEYGSECARVSKRLAEHKELPGRLAHAESERDALQLKGAAVTALTHSGFVCSKVLQALAETASPELRLMAVSLDFDQGKATLTGYGSEETADIEVATFLRSLNANRAVRDTFVGARLDHCNSARRNDVAVKQFSITMEFREGKLQQMIRETDEQEEQG